MKFPYNEKAARLSRALQQAQVTGGWGDYPIDAVAVCGFGVQR